jgi:hypothetical protein
MNWRESTTEEHSHFVLILTKRDDEVGSARQVLTRRFADGLWPLGARTRLQTKVKQGDRVLVYVPETGGDKEGKHFLASAVIAGERVPSERSERTTFGLGRTSAILYDLPLINAEWFHPVVALLPLLPKLEFIRIKSSWKSYFIGGITRISPSDYQTVLLHSKSD